MARDDERVKELARQMQRERQRLDNDKLLAGRDERARKERCTSDARDAQRRALARDADESEALAEATAEGEATAAAEHFAARQGREHEKRSYQARTP